MTVTVVKRQTITGVGPVRPDNTRAVFTAQPHPIRMPVSWFGPTLPTVGDVLCHMSDGTYALQRMGEPSPELATAAQAMQATQQPQEAQKKTEASGSASGPSWGKLYRACTLIRAAHVTAVSEKPDADGMVEAILDDGSAISIHQVGAKTGDVVIQPADGSHPCEVIPPEMFAEHFEEVA